MADKILGSCAKPDCTENKHGFILAGETFDVHTVLVAGKKEMDLYHRPCNPHADHSRDEPGRESGHTFAPGDSMTNVTKEAA